MSLVVDDLTADFFPQPISEEYWSGREEEQEAFWGVGIGKLRIVYDLQFADRRQAERIKRNYRNRVMSARALRDATMTPDRVRGKQPPTAPIREPDRVRVSPGIPAPTIFGVKCTPTGTYWTARGDVWRMAERPRFVADRIKRRLKILGFEEQSEWVYVKGGRAVRFFNHETWRAGFWLGCGAA